MSEMFSSVFMMVVFYLACVGATAVCDIVLARLICQNKERWYIPMTILFNLTIIMNAALAVFYDMKYLIYLGFMSMSFAGLTLVAALFLIQKLEKTWRR